MRVGDLLFFRIGGKVSHVGMYLGNRRFVHAPSTGREVSTASLDSDFYRRAFVRAARPD
jgi:cell wall-associated NlpC family hydrolase